MRRAVFMGFVAALAACAPAVVHPAAQDVAWAERKWPGTTLAELTRGRQIYVAKCAGCHSLRRPEEYPPRVWEAWIAEMEEDSELLPEESGAVLRYLASTSARLRGPPQPRKRTTPVAARSGP